MSYLFSWCKVHFNFSDVGPVFHMPPCFSVVIQVINDLSLLFSSPCSSLSEQQLQLIVACFTPCLIYLLYWELKNRVFACVCTWGTFNRNQREATGIFQLQQMMIMNQKEIGYALHVPTHLWLGMILWPPELKVISICW